MKPSSPFQRVAERLDIERALSRGSQSNDLLPPRPEDKVGGELGNRVSGAITRQLERGSYDPGTAYFVQVPKSSYATRPAALLSLQDRVVYQALVDALRPRIEASLLGSGVVMWPRGEPSEKRWHSFERSPLLGSATHVVIADISGFYESIAHERLGDVLITATGRVPETEALIELLNRVMGAARGLPQGLEASDPLATVYISSVDFALTRLGYDYARHGDDIRLGASSFEHARQALYELERSVRACGLLLNSSKTKILRREAYANGLSTIEETIAETAQCLLAAKIDAVSTDEGELTALLEAANLQHLGWALLYHQQISIEDVIEQLEEHLQPDDIAIAERMFLDTIDRQPGHPEGLSSDVFHQRLVTSVIRLAAVKSLVPLKHIGALMRDFPDKTMELSHYLLAVAGSSPQDVAQQVEGLLNPDRFQTEWETAWAIRVLKRVPQFTTSATIDRLNELVSAPQDNWLAVVEAVQVLGHRGLLDHSLLLRLWNLCPRVFQTDLLLAAASMVDTVAWARPMVEAAREDPVHAVALRQAERSRPDEIIEKTPF